MNFRPRAAFLATVLAVTFCLIAVSPALAQSPAVPQRVISVEGITEYQLGNGLRVLLFPDQASPTVTVNLTVFVGSRHEGYGETGMAHLLEHMLFKGTPRHRDIPTALRDRGADYNASTWLDRTNYFETLSASDANLEFALDLEADRVINSYVKREDLLSEMTVVRNEFEMGENNPQNVLSERLMSAAYAFHNYAKPTIGNRSDIERVPIDRLQAFYRKYYRPDNCMLVIAGKFDEPNALRLVAKYFGTLKRPVQPIEATYTEEPAQDGERNVTLRRVGKVGVAGALYHIPAAAHDDFAAIQVLVNALTSAPSGRLYKELVEGKKAARVSGVAMSLHDPGVVEFTAEAAQGQSPESVRDSLLNLLENVGKDKLPTAAVERAKRELLTQRELLLTHSSLVGRILSEWGAMGDWRLLFLNRDRLAQVTADDVNRVAARYLARNNRTAGVYVPTDRAERANIPETAPAAEVVKGYRGKEAMAQGEVFEPTLENVEKRVRRFDLAGGAKVAFLSKKTRGEAVVATITLHYGNAESMRGHTSATQFLATLMQRGTRGHTRQQLKDEWNRLGASVRGNGLLGDASFSVQAKRSTLREVLKLLGEVLREPTFPADELEVLKRETRARLERGLTEPTALASRALQRRLSPYPPEDVRYVPTIPESIARLDVVSVDEVRALYASQVGGQSAQVAVVGDFDPDSTRRVLADILGGWKSGVPFHRIERPAQTDVAGTRETIETPDKANAVYAAGEMLAVADTDPDFPALELTNFLLGGDTMSSRLGKRVRGQGGLSYGIGSQFSASSFDRSAQFLVFAICNPANIDKVAQLTAEELEKLLTGGVHGKELADARKGYLAQLKVQRARDASLAAMLAEDLYVGRTFAYDAELERKIEELTPEQVSACARRHLVPGRLVIIHAGDFKKQARGGS